MNAKKIIVSLVLLAILSSTAADAFPLFGGSNYGGRGRCDGYQGHHHRHHHRRGW
jgi:hypothetical protein